MGPDGVERDALEVGYQNPAEHWNEYLLDDGTVLRLKPVVTQIIRIEGLYDHNGDPAYQVQSMNVVTVSAPEQLRKGGQSE